MKVAVIGGGPIGLAQAILLSKEGIEVDLFEKGSWPKDKTCGQGLMPSGQNILKEIGITFNEGQDSYRFSGITYIDKNLKISGILPQKGRGVERRILSEKLFNRCKQIPLITLYPNTNIQSLNIKKNSIEINGSSYEYVFACDGLNSPTRKFLENEARRTSELRMGAREHIDQAPWTNKVEVYWNDGIEAYVTPVSEERIEVAFLWFKNKIKDPRNLREVLWNSFPELEKRCQKSGVTNDFRGSGPFSTYSKSIKKDNIFFVGDAYNFLDGITGEGISLGLKSAKYIAKNHNNWNIFDSIRIKTYYLHYFILVKLALTLSSRRRLRRLIFKFVQKSPKSFNMVLRLNDL